MDHRRGVARMKSSFVMVLNENWGRNRLMRNRTRLRVCLIFQVLAATLIVLSFAGCDSDEEESAILFVESEPEDGATIKIGSKIYGRTPMRISGLPVGEHYVKLSLDRHKRAFKAVTLPETGEVRIVVRMDLIVGYLTLKSDPPRAQVYLDGVEHLGETPLTAKAVPVGIHSYELRLEDHLKLEGEVEILEDRHYSFMHLITPMEGQIQVFSRPSGADIYINDILQEKTTPTRFSVKPGTYTVGVYKKGYIMAEKAVQMEPNGEEAVDLVLEEGEVPPGMVLIPAGEFIFGVNGGAPDEAPEQKVYLKAYYIDKLEVTNQQFAQIFPGHVFDPLHADHPVQGVSWRQAVAYAEAVGKRLPTEKEWEKAARGPDGREYPWGSGFDPALCNAYRGPDSKATKVAQYRGGASPYGLMDMSGNVYEWTFDWYEPYEGNTEIKAEYGQIYRVLRGGSYQSDEYHVRAPRRHFARMDLGRRDYGLRCAMDVEDLGSQD